MLCGLIERSWPGYLAFTLLFGFNVIGRRLRQRDAIDPPPTMVRMDEVPLNPLWGLRHPKQWSHVMAEIFRVRRNQREFREWQERHGLGRKARRSGQAA